MNLLPFFRSLVSTAARDNYLYDQSLKLRDEFVQIVVETERKLANLNKIIGQQTWTSQQRRDNFRKEPNDNENDFMKISTAKKTILANSLPLENDRVHETKSQQVDDSDDLEIIFEQINSQSDESTDKAELGRFQPFPPRPNALGRPSFANQAAVHGLRRPNRDTKPIVCEISTSTRGAMPIVSDRFNKKAKF